MKTKGAQSRGNLSGKLTAGHIVHFTTDTSVISMLPSIVGGISESREREHIFILPFCFIFLFLDSYYILFYAISLSCIIHSVLCQVPNFAALDDGIVRLVVKHLYPKCLRLLK
jgi:hypothetical protein